MQENERLLGGGDKDEGIHGQDNSAPWNMIQSQNIAPSNPYLSQDGINHTNVNPMLALPVGNADERLLQGNNGSNQLHGGGLGDGSSLGEINNANNANGFIPIQEKGDGGYHPVVEYFSAPEPTWIEMLCQISCCCCWLIWDLFSDPSMSNT